MAKASHPYDFDRFEPSGLPHYDVTYLEMGRPGLWRRPCKLTDNIKEIPYSVLCILPWPRLIDHQARQPFNTTTAIGIDFRHKRSYDISRSPDLGLISTSSSLPTCGRGPTGIIPGSRLGSTRVSYPHVLSLGGEPSVDECGYGDEQDYTRPLITVQTNGRSSARKPNHQS